MSTVRLMPTFVVWWAYLAAPISVVFGWHSLCNHVLEERLRTYVHTQLVDADTSVEVSTFSNVVEVDIKRRVDSADNPFQRLGDVLVEFVGRSAKPSLEEEMRLYARKNFDLYAMILPYDVSVHVGHTERKAPIIEHAGSNPASVFAEQSSAPGRSTEGLTAPSSALSK